jgi:hypothetical protein
MSDEYQIEVPPSFQALYTDARRRLTVPLAALRARYEVCEDLAQQLVDSAQHIHHDLGVAQDEVLHRLHAGLADPEAGLAPQEPRWVLRRLIELANWPVPEDWDPPPVGGSTVGPVGG